jgi:hypothetical protein
VEEEVEKEEVEEEEQKGVDQTRLGALILILYANS